MKKSFEGSKADRREDAKGARKLGLSQSDYERSPEDERADRMARRAGPPKRGPGRPAAPPYELSPAKERDQRAMTRRANAVPAMPPAEDFE